tara:strand:+ start:887 stop:1402 length:516 start_codon:yes stop_codon:yes gene_type:complete
VNKKSAPGTIPTEIFECLQHGRVYLISKQAIVARVNKTSYDYYNAFINYEDRHFEVSTNNKDARRELRSLQRQIITTLTRLRYFATGFNVPNFINLSDGRRLRLIREHVNSVRDVLNYVESVPPLIDIYKRRVHNITFKTDEDALAERNVQRQFFENSLAELRTWIRAQYV